MMDRIFSFLFSKHNKIKKINKLTKQFELIFVNI
jgi:hypothetical protein